VHCFPEGSCNVTLCLEGNLKGSCRLYGFSGIQNLLENAERSTRLFLNDDVTSPGLSRPQAPALDSQ
jgi:hypothetical protein